MGQPGSVSTYSCNTGTEIIEENRSTGQREFKFLQGPLFANVVLADEINRTPPKTQAALLQAMQEYKVTVAGTDYPLEKPFLVLGTQNPVEQEGTYPLPEAQLDRFMFDIRISYPKPDEERLGEARDADQERVAPGQEGDEHELDDVRLADHPGA